MDDGQAVAPKKHAGGRPKGKSTRPNVRYNPKTMGGKKTPKTIKELLGYLSKGYTIVAACSAIPITPQTFYTWCKEDDGFRLAAEQAMHQVERDLTDSVLKFGKVDGNLALKTLGIRFSDDWGEKRSKGETIPIIIEIEFKGPKFEMLPDGDVIEIEEIKPLQIEGENK